MRVYKEIDSAEKFGFWSGAVSTYNNIVDADKENEFWDLLEEIFSDREYVSETEINDFIWFERDYIYNLLGLDRDGKLIDNDDDDEDNDLWGDDNLDDEDE